MIEKEWDAFDEDDPDQSWFEEEEGPERIYYLLPGFKLGIDDVDAVLAAGPPNRDELHPVDYELLYDRWIRARVIKQIRDEAPARAEAKRKEDAMGDATKELEELRRRQADLTAKQTELRSSKLQDHDWDSAVAELAGEQARLGNLIAERERRLPYVGMTDDELAEKLDDLEAREEAAKEARDKFPEATAPKRRVGAEREYQGVMAERLGLARELKLRRDYAEMGKYMAGEDRTKGRAAFDAETARLNKELAELGGLIARGQLDPRVAEPKMRWVGEAIADPKRLDRAIEEARKAREARMEGIISDHYKSGAWGPKG